MLRVIATILIFISGVGFGLYKGFADTANNSFPAAACVVLLVAGIAIHLYDMVEN